MVEMNELRMWIQEGGIVRFTWATCKRELIVGTFANSFSRTIDGRTYSGFLKTLAPSLERTETGTVEAKDLVIEWRKK